jgi:RNA-directed DNA polymerase
MLERAMATTRQGKYTAVQYARYADDLVILVDAHPRHAWLMKAVDKRLREELAKLQVEINEEKSRVVDLRQGESFSFLGFEFRRVLSFRGKWRPPLHAAAEEAHGLIGKAQRNLPKVRQSTPGTGDHADQPNSAGAG